MPHDDRCMEIFVEAEDARLRLFKHIKEEAWGICGENQLAHSARLQGRVDELLPEMAPRELSNVMWAHG